MPPIIQGNDMTETKRPFLGRSRVNKVIGAINSILKTQVRVVSLVGNANNPAIPTSTQPSWIITEKSSILTIPIPIASSGTNTQGWFWPVGAARNYDKTGTFQDQQVVFVGPTNDAVVSGVTDPDSGLPVKSLPGLWVALRAVAPLAGPNYHIPQLPLPTPDDVTASNNYWLMISQAPQCV